MLIKINEDIKIIEKDSDYPLSNLLQSKIDKYWTKFLKGKENYWNGVVYVVEENNLENNQLFISKTNFSTIVYARNNSDLNLYSLFVGILLKTKDNKYLVFKNNHNQLNIIGGMADGKDIKNNQFIPDLCLERELKEELNLLLHNKEHILNYKMKYVKIFTNSHKIYPAGILYTGTLNFTSYELLNYLKHTITDKEVKTCYFYTPHEILHLKLGRKRINYLKEMIKIESEGELIYEKI